jgi:SAM-dependent methyltransferase
LAEPYPPFELANRVLSLEGFDDPLAVYDNMGAETKAALLDLLPDGWSFEDKRVLDFGCGAGRTLRHFLVEAETAELWGADIDALSIAWLDENLSPPLHTLHCAPAPPLGLEGGSFDLIWAISVFTHLTDQSLAWLVELHRLLGPGGLLMASYTGRWSSELLAGEPWDEDRVGMNVLHHDQGWDQGGPMVLMSDWWVREHWGRAFEFLAVEPQVHGQTWALLRRRDVELSAEELAEPSGDPREYAALRHNVEQLQREQQSVRHAYERSLSWRLTRPLRRLSAGFRAARRSSVPRAGRATRRGSRSPGRSRSG